MAQKNAVYQVDNGSGFDEIHFRTNESMIVNSIQQLGGTGYRKLPNGLILQWGAINGFGAGSSTRINFSVSFLTECYGIFTQFAGDRTGHWRFTAGGINNTSFNLITDLVSGFGDRYRVCFWFAIGK